VKLAITFLFVALHTVWVVGVSTDTGPFTLLEATVGQVSESRGAARSEAELVSHALVHTGWVQREDSSALDISPKSTTSCNLGIHLRSLDTVPSSLVSSVTAVPNYSGDVGGSSI